MKILRSLYVQVLIAIVIGVLTGHFYPAFGVTLEPLGTAFIKAIKMLIAPIIFCTVVSGIASMGDLKKVGRVGWKALLYFEVVTTIALFIGLGVAHTFKPGVGFSGTASATEKKRADEYQAASQKHSMTDFVLDIIPSTFVNAFVETEVTTKDGGKRTEGSILQVLFLSILASIALTKMGPKAAPVLDLLHTISNMFFGIVGIVTKVAPVAAFGAMAFTVGKYGFGTLASLGKLMLCVYVTCALFIFIVLGLIARAHGFGIFKVLKHIKEEFFITIGTSSSEAALPSLMKKMGDSGCGKSVVGIVLPAGYSFNLDGTSIYLTLAAIFISQATNTPLTWGQEFALLGVLMLTSKGAAAVTGGGFITLAATLSATHALPVSGLALLIGVDRFMSEARAITNLIGNTVAMLVVAKWEGEFDRAAGKVLLAQEG